jgi:phosphoribosyl 1,2-cyclic phosphodiesterase
VKVSLWGTRGSLPEAGLPTVRYGGNTSCVTIEGSSGQLLVLDAGTGIRRFGTSVDPDIREVHILLTHLHMDHIQGLGFFKPLFSPTARMHIWGPPSTTMDLRERLGRYLSPPLFPVLIRDLPCDLVLHDTPRGEFQIGEFAITADLICHPGPTMGYRITNNGGSMAYLPDHEPSLGRDGLEEPGDWISGCSLARGVDLLIHDAQYTEDEYDSHAGWGHSSIRDAIAFASIAQVARMVAFHHDPAREDAEIDRITQEATRAYQPRFELVAGEEGAVFEIA